MIKLLLDLCIDSKSAEREIDSLLIEFLGKKSIKETFLKNFFVERP